MREISVDKLTENIKEMCIEANHFLSPDMDAVLKAATEKEDGLLGKQILDSLQENMVSRDIIKYLQTRYMEICH